MAGPVSSFYAQIGVNTRIQDLRKVDRYLKLVERKMQRFEKGFGKNFSLGISNFFVNRRALRTVLSTALDRASKDVVFEVSRFAVNERNLRAAMLRAGRHFAREAIPYQPARQATSSAMSQRERPALADKSGRNFMYGGGTAGALARYGIGSVPFIGGAYGLMQLNRGTQELQANAMSLEAAAGNPADAVMYKDFINNLGNRLGKKTSTMTPFFAQMLAGSKGTALEPHLMTGFESLMEYSSVMMLDEQKIKGTIRAFTQMIGKQQIMAEELRGQAAEHLPPIVRLMADVAAGGDTKKLNKMMEMGQLDPNVHLPLLFARLKKEAEPMLPKYFKTSVFAQGMMAKKLEDLLKRFGEGGGDSGFARLFLGVADAASRLAPAIDMLAKSFDWFTKQLQLPLTLLGDIGGHIDRLAPSFRNLKAGIDSVHPSLGKLLAIGAMLLTPWTRIFAVFSGLFLILEDISVGMMGGLSYTGRFFDFLEKFVEFDRGIMGVAMAFIAVAAAIKLTSAVAKASLLGDLLNPNKTKKPGGAKPPTTGKAVGAALLGATAGTVGLPLTLLAAYWAMNSDELQERLKVNYSSEEIVNSLLAPFGSTLGVIATELDPVLKKLDPHQRTEYFEGLSKPGKQGMWEDLSGYIDYKSGRDAAWLENNQHLSDIPSIPTSAEQALAQVAPVNKTNNINNTFEINIEGALDPQGLATMMENQIIPQFEVFFNNQLDVVNQTFGSE